MRKPTINAMKILALLISLIGITGQSYAQHENTSMYHEMQHGFVLSADDKFASHLVATGHHSRQAEIIGELLIDDQQEMEIYQERKLQSAGRSYFLFQAQSLDLPTLTVGQMLTGHIVESKMGNYEPQNRIVRSATFRVQKILLNISNPFFTELTHHGLSSPTKTLQRKEGSNLNDILSNFKSKKKHCCDTGAKPCNWKC